MRLLKQFLPYLACLVLGMLILGCGSKKKITQREKEKIAYTETKDGQTKIKNDITSNVNITKQSKKTTIAPEDPTKESSYNGVPFKNAKITEEETTEGINGSMVDNSGIDHSDNSNIDFNSDQKSTNIDLDKDTSFNVFDWLWLFLAIGIVLFIVRLYIKKINPLTWIKTTFFKK